MLMPGQSELGSCPGMPGSGYASEHTDIEIVEGPDDQLPAMTGNAESVLQQVRWYPTRAPEILGLCHTLLRTILTQRGGLV